MIKLERGVCPDALTEEVCQELTKLYSENKAKDVWNSPKIKNTLKKSLMEMSYRKRVYCECKLDVESKDVTIDHFLPKSTNPDKVVEWKNLFPSCLRCNREKSDYEGKIINPCENEPKEYIALSAKNRYCLESIDANAVGKNTIISVNLNDIQRVMVPRMLEWEEIHERLADIWEDLKEDGYKEKYKRKFEILMRKCTSDNSYAAVKATNMLDDDCYMNIKKMLKEKDRWTIKIQELEGELKRIALRLI